MSDDTHPALDTTGRFEKVAVAEVYLGGDQWAIAAVWRDRATARLYGDVDSGCPCYVEWDPAYTDLSLGGCRQITHKRDAELLLDELNRGALSTTERHDFIRAVSIALAQ